MSDITPNGQVILAALNATGSKPKAPVRFRPDSAQYANDDAYQVAVETANNDYALALTKFEADSLAYDQQLKANAREIKIMLGDRSRISEQLDQLDKILDPSNDGGKVFPGTITGIATEERTKRAIVTVYTGTERETSGVPAGHEQVRTDFTTNPDGRSIARAAQLLIGHRVYLYVELEAMKSGTGKARVLRHIEDSGVDTRFKEGAVQV